MVSSFTSLNDGFSVAAVSGFIVVDFPVCTERMEVMIACVRQIVIGDNDKFL
jgi:hypothetical protein